MSREVKISYPRFLRLINLFSLCVFAQNSDIDVLLIVELKGNESHFCGDRKGEWVPTTGHKISVFRILDKDDIIKVKVFQDINSKCILGLNI